MFASWRNFWSRLRPKPPAFKILTDEEKFQLLEGDRTRSQFSWSEVQEVVTFKLDCWIYDDIRLAFRVRENWIEVSEEIEGWADLSAEIARQFPEIPPDWLSTVMLPTFETCYRVLYKRTIDKLV